MLDDLSCLVPGTVNESLNSWSEALTVGLVVKTAKPLS